MMNIEELKRLAEAATPGPWISNESWQSMRLGARHSGKYEIRKNGRLSPSFQPLALVRGDKRITGGNGKDNADYIAAANPAAVLELIAEVEALRADVATERALSFRDQVAALEGQRDELLAALYGMVQLDRENHQRGDDDIDIAQEVQDAYNAIAKVEG